MKIAFLYLGIAAMGYLIAAFLGKEKDKFKWIGTVLPGIVTALIFLMGFRIGENEEVVGNIGTIGFQSLVMALVSMAFTLAATGLLRRALGYDRYGLRKKNGGAEEAAEVQDRGKKRKGKLFSKSTVRYLIAVISGFILGYLLVIKTGAGMAMAAAAALDHLRFPEIVGSIAGDDTIMAAVRTVEETKELM